MDAFYLTAVFVKDFIQPAFDDSIFSLAVDKQVRDTESSFALKIDQENTNNFLSYIDVECSSSPSFADCNKSLTDKQKNSKRL